MAKTTTKDKFDEFMITVKRHWQLFAVAGVTALILLGWVSGMLVQALNTMSSMGSSFAVSQTDTSGTDTAGGVSFNLFTCLKYGFLTGSGWKLIFLLILAIVGVTVVFMMYRKKDTGEKDAERNFIYSEKDTYGTAGWMSKKEMHTALDVKPVEKTKGIILGATKEGDVVSIVPTIRKSNAADYTDADRKKSMRTNKHVCVLGASGSMKSRTYVRNAIFQCARRNESMVITDPKGEMYEDMAGLLIDEGYNVKVFNLKDQVYSDSWDCLAEVGNDEVMAQIFSSVIIQNTTDGKGDHFFDSAEMNLLKALVLYVCIENPKTGGPVTMGEVYRLLTTKKSDELTMMFESLDKTHAAYAPYAIYAQASENVRGNVIIGLASRTQVFQSQVTKDITAFPEIDLTALGREKTAYFCAISDQDSTYKFLSSLFFSFLFIKLVRFADNFGKEPGKLDVPVNFILDEFSNIGLIPDFEKKISTVRSRDINISVIIQNIPQLKSRYPNDVWQEIIGNCDTQLFLGCTDETTSKYISNRSGVATIDITSKQTVQQTAAMAQYIPEFKQTESVGKRNVLNPDEVLCLPSMEALVIIRGEKLLKIQKYDFTRHPMSKQMRPTRMSDRMPRWRRRELKAEFLGYQLRAAIDGKKYYLDIPNGVYYERTDYLSATEPTRLLRVESKAIDYNEPGGYRLVKNVDEDGNRHAFILNEGTGESSEIVGFDESDMPIYLSVPRTADSTTDDPDTTTDTTTAGGNTATAAPNTATNDPDTATDAPEEASEATVEDVEKEGGPRTEVRAEPELTPAKPEKKQNNLLKTLEYLDRQDAARRAKQAAKAASESKKAPETQKPKESQPAPEKKQAPVPQPAAKFALPERPLSGASITFTEAPIGDDFALPSQKKKKQGTERPGYQASHDAGLDLLDSAFKKKKGKPEPHEKEEKPVEAQTLPTVRPAQKPVPDEEIQAPVIEEDDTTFLAMSNEFDEFDTVN